MVITKTLMIEKLAKKLGIDKTKAAEFVNEYQNMIIEEVSAGNEVKLAGFASFDSTERKGRMMKNPRTGEDIYVDAHRGVSIRPFKAFKDLVKKDQ